MIALDKNRFQSHPYHLVDPSPWPISMSFALLVLTVSAVLYMQGFKFGGYLLNLGVILVSTGMGLWFRDIIVESTYLGHHTEQVKRGLTIGIALFIVSELMAFLSIFWAYFHSSLSPSVEIGGTWPPLGIETLDPLAIPLLNTILLLSSGAFITYGHHALIAGKRIFTINSFFMTIVLAVVFTLFQYIEYTDSGFSMADSVFGSSFYASTGLHGFHVIIGTIFIFIGFLRIINYNVTKQGHLGIETAILYWHFVDIVWLFLFIAVYFWGSN